MKTITELKREIKELCEKLSWDYKAYLDEDLNPEEMDEVEGDMKKAQLKTLQEVCKEIKRKIKIHEKHFDRYSKEVKKYAKDKKQVEYSDNQAIKEMNIIDELKELLKKFGESNE